METSPPAAPALAAHARAAERAAGDDEPPVQSFGAVLEQTLAEAVAANRRGEEAATQAAQGAAGLQDVIEAVHAAELSLQSVVAVRDRVIAAYQEIMRMPI